MWRIIADFDDKKFKTKGAQALCLGQDITVLYLADFVDK